MRGPQPEKVEEKPVMEETMMLRLPLPTSAPAILPPPTDSPETAGVVALSAPADGVAKEEGVQEGSPPAAAPGEKEASPDATQAEGATDSPSLASSLLPSPAEEAAKAAAAAEVQAQQEATMAALEAVSSTKPQGELPPVASVHLFVDSQHYYACTID